MPSLREAQKQLTRDMIVERALELFTEKGYAATTIDEIAAAAGTTRVTFYAYYPSRSDLMRDFMARVNAVLDRADGPDLASTAPELVDVVRGGKLLGHPCLARVAGGALAGLPPLPRRARRGRRRRPRGAGTGRGMA